MQWLSQAPALRELSVATWNFANYNEITQAFENGFTKVKSFYLRLQRGMPMDMKVLRSLLKKMCLVEEASIEVTKYKWN